MPDRHPLLNSPCKPLPPLFVLSTNICRAKRMLIVSGMAVASPERIRDASASHMPPPPAIVSARQHCPDDAAPALEPHMAGEDAHSDTPDTSSKDGSGASMNGSSDSNNNSLSLTSNSPGGGGGSSNENQCHQHQPQQQHQYGQPQHQPQQQRHCHHQQPHYCQRQCEHKPSSYP